MVIKARPGTYWFSPLLRPRESLVSPVQICAIDTVRLMAGDGLQEALHQFYTGLLGLFPAQARADGWAYRLGLIRVELLLHAARCSDLAVTADTLPFTGHAHRQKSGTPGTGGDMPKVFGQMAIIVRNFSAAVDKIGSHCEVIHGDTGLCRSAVLRDPASNCIYLLETRPF